MELWNYRILQILQVNTINIIYNIIILVIHNKKKDYEYIFIYDAFNTNDTIL